MRMRAAACGRLCGSAIEGGKSSSSVRCKKLSTCGGLRNVDSERGGRTVDYDVRWASPTDVDGIITVARDTWEATYENIMPKPVRERALAPWYANESLLRAVQNPLGAFFVAVANNGRIVGFAEPSHRRAAGHVASDDFAAATGDVAVDDAAADDSATDDSATDDLAKDEVAVDDVATDSVVSDGARSEDAELWRIYVLPPYQGLGLGRRLIHASVESLQNMAPVRRLYVQVEKENVIGRWAYDALGFVAVREYEVTIFGQPCRMTEMCLEL